jgi:hypothetical protein
MLASDQPWLRTYFHGTRGDRLIGSLDRRMERESPH